MRSILIALCLIPFFIMRTSSYPEKINENTIIQKVDKNFRNQSDAVIGIDNIIEITQDVENPDPVQKTGISTDKNSNIKFLDENIEPAKHETAVSAITLSFAGDCTVGDDESYKWNTFDEVYDRVDDPSYFLKCVQSVFANDDYTFVNLEGTFTNETKKAVKEYRFKGKPSYVSVLTSGSVEGVTLANNHTLDYLQKGFDDTVAILNDEKIDYAYFDKTIIKEIKGLKVGYVGYKGWSHETRSNTLLKEHVKWMREQGVRFIVANYHWGDMYSYVPNTLQKRMAHFAVDNGVDLVIGHHPHIIQGMEVYKGKNILYSLGNFCYGGSSNPKDKDTIIYQHILSYNDMDGTISDSGYKIIPARISSDPEKNNYQPVLATGGEEERILKKFYDISKNIK